MNRVKLSTPTDLGTAPEGIEYLIEDYIRNKGGLDKCIENNEVTIRIPMIGINIHNLMIALDEYKGAGWSGYEYLFKDSEVIIILRQ